MIGGKKRGRKENCEIYLWIRRVIERARAREGEKERETGGLGGVGVGLQPGPIHKC